VCIAVIARALRAETHVLEEQDSFLALVSHQFKTPLASLQLSLETLALRAPTPQAARTLIDRMLADLARMELMVTQILESARLERGRVEFKSEPLELAGAVARVVTQLEERARQERVRISSDIAAGLHVASDPLALDVVVRNVLENALAAVASAGGGSIALTARALAGEVELSVRDSGVGFPPADGARLFEKFTRLPGSRAGHYGTGLGLFIVRRLMELARGRVSAHSEGVGRGASFVLTWPAAAPEPRP
jgi:signal transduction histidine kinase